MTTGFSRTFDRALVLAALVHAGATRKGTAIPYIIHPVHVAAILLRHGYPEPVAVAALLHDVLEDIDYEDGTVQLAVRTTFPLAALPAGVVDAATFRPPFLQFVRGEFGDHVFSLVEGMTEPKNDGGQRRSWRERREIVLERLKDGSEELVALKAADVLHNVRSIAEDIAHHGATVLGRFKASPAETLWYYQSVAEIVRQRLGTAPIAIEVSEAIAVLQPLVPREHDGPVGA
jgi:(p)ppGpp synthase/HD superfamily hydrolase